MSSNGDIYITISDRRSGGGDSPSPQPNPPQPDKPQAQDNSQKREYDYISHLAEDFLESKTREIVNAGINSIGNFTGNYQLQRDIQAGLSNLSKILGIGMATLAGAKYGPHGAIAGFVISAASTVISDTLNAISQNKAVANTNAEIEQLRTRAGLNSLTNGGRTG